MNKLSAVIFFSLVCLSFGDDSSCHSVPFIQTAGSLTALGYSPKCVAEALSKCTEESICKNSESSHENTKNPLSDDFTSSSASEKKAIGPFSCADITKTDSEVETLHLPGLDRQIEAFCDQETEGGGWTIIQRRENPVNGESFMRNWTEYSQGFGNVNGSYWLGLENISEMTHSVNMSLLILFEHPYPELSLFAHYDRFRVAPEDQDFFMTVGEFRGNATESFSYQNGERFRTYDKGSRDGCPNKEAGGWWHKDCRTVNLNGSTRFSFAEEITEIIWKGMEEYRSYYTRTIMMIRPRNFQK